MSITDRSDELGEEWDGAEANHREYQATAVDIEDEPSEFGEIVIYREDNGHAWIQSSVSIPRDNLR